MTRTSPFRRLAPLCLVAPLLLPATAQAEDWDWAVAPYFWLIGVKTDVSTNDPPSNASADSEFSDLIENIEGVFQVHAEGQGDRFGIFTDFTYLGVSDEDDRPIIRTETDLDARLFELAGVWSPSPDRYKGFEVFGGLRYIDLDVTLRLEPVNPAFNAVSVNAGNSYSDFMLGARYTWDFSDRWGMTLRGDGSFGDTEGTFNASAMLQYRMDHGAWLFGYRYLDAEFEDPGDTTNLTVYGPVIGYAFRF